MSGTFLISDFVFFECLCSLNKSRQSDEYIFLAALWLLEDWIRTSFYFAGVLGKMLKIYNSGFAFDEPNANFVLILKHWTDQLKRIANIPWHSLKMAMTSFTWFAWGTHPYGSCRIVLIYKKTRIHPMKLKGTIYVLAFWVFEALLLPSTNRNILELVFFIFP